MIRSEQKEYEAWLELRKRIATQTAPERNETEREKRDRIAGLLKDFDAFCRYYFPHYMDAAFGWFHRKAAQEVKKRKDGFFILEWPREHAKSVFADIMLPMYLKACGELDGMMIGSASGDKANGLLSDIQAELMDNQRYIADFGEQFSLGNWQEGHFATADGVGFWAFGRGQSPRGTRNAAKRPNYGVIDDIDDKMIVKNDERVKEATDWVLADFYGALSIKGARLVIAGNRIHKKAILAHLVGDVEPEDPKREGIVHIKVFAIEDEKRRPATPEHGRPAWHERYTMAQLTARMTKMGYRNARREFFHEHIEEGNVFRLEHMTWVKARPLREYDELITYVDPSFKDTKKSDYKGVVLLGRIGSQLDVLWCWVRQAAAAMVKAHYDCYERIQAAGASSRDYMEANFLQDLLLDEYQAEGNVRNYQLPIRPDKRSKPDKYTRIENLEPLWQRGNLRFNEAERKSVDMLTLRDQFLAFPTGHDDGPDAVEGAVSLLQRGGRSADFKPRLGRITTSSARRG